MMINEFFFNITRVIHMLSVFNGLEKLLMFNFSRLLSGPSSNYLFVIIIVANYNTGMLLVSVLFCFPENKHI